LLEYSYTGSFSARQHSRALGIAIPGPFSNPGISGLRNANPGIPGLGTSNRL